MTDAASTLPSEGALVVSIVSHGHGALVERLLTQMAQLKSAPVTRVILTQNLPEPRPVPPARGWPFVLDLLCNAVPRGFGDNHNRALENACEPFVCVLNPDVTLVGDMDPFVILVSCAAQPGVGCAYPRQVNLQGERQDSEREWPTPGALWRRHVWHRPDVRADWVNAACLVLPREAWRQVQGFDTGYFMYCEDVDLCLRLRLAGWALVRSSAVVEHAGQRASRRQWRHFAWHVGALLRLWRSPAYRQGRFALGASLPDQS